MAKSSTRRVTIYINGKEVEASVKQIRAEMNRLVNEQNRMVIGSDEYIAHAKKIKELSKKGYSPYVYIKINIRYLSRTHIRRQQRELIGFLVHRIDGHGSAVLRYEAPERHPVILELKVAGTPRLDCGYERIHRRRLQGDGDRHEQMHIVQQQRAGLRYAVRTKDVFGYTSSATYDYRFGKPLAATDLNGNSMKYHYDEWGRLDTLVGPNELSANKPYTIAMRYHPYLSSGEHHVTDPSSYAVTFHYDCQHPTNPIKTILFCDGSGRILQTKKDAEVAGTPKLLNSGRVAYDCFGRAIGQYHPFSSSLSDTVYNAYFDPVTLTSSTYDILDRPLKVKLPTHDSTCTAYGFDSHNGKTYFRTTTTDANGISVSVLTGTRKQQVKTIAPLNAVTTFTYDALGQLLSSSDPCQHATTYTYDMLGRMIQRVHPDAGTDTYTYDGAGNVTTHSTQVLANANKTINYYYSYNRLDSIVYPTNRQNNVRYTYGDSTATHNQRGRIALLEDASGFQTFKYGRMGEVIENNRTFVLPNERYPYSFKMKYTYDSWNRVQDITYPDGEVVHYKYNTGGMLRQVQGQRSFFSGLDSVIIGPFDPLNPREDEYDDPTADNAPNGGTMGDRSEYHNYTYDYINDIQYNEFELKSAILYGNGTSAQYSYDILNRLSRLKLYDAANNYLQNITYSYDAVGNIDAIQNTADRISGSNLGGTYTYTYKYDDLYRLTTAIGSTNIRVRATESTGSTRIQYASYTQRMRYDKDGKILSKSQISRTSLNGSDTYSNTANDYIYNSGQPHTVRATSASEFSWDANGNMIEQDAARMSWDEENQLREYSNRRSLAVAFYQYDAGGERFYKNTGERTTLVVNGRRVEMPYYHIPTLYTSPYLVATPQSYTKHYFMESERFASRIGDGTITNINNHVTTDATIAAKQAQANAYAPDSIQTRLFERLRALPFNWSSHHTTYWQHSDHLGSASWITDTNGLGYQHLQYMAWGEPLVDQRRSGANYEARFTFSGKERDEESGFCYFGARLHNPNLSIWLSVDPMSDKYPSTSPYTYCANNPVKLVDPNGDTIINFYKQIVINAQEIYNRAVSQNQPDLSHETKVLEDAKTNYYYVDQFINGLSDDQYKALDNIKDEQGNPINIIVDVDYNLKTVAANKPQWTKGKQLLNNRLTISINPFRDENNKESNLPIFDWRKFARHEGGHAYYIIRKSVEYFDWLVKKGHINENGKPLHKYNGHGKGDKSAEHARIWETGNIELINDEQR